MGCFRKGHASVCVLVEGRGRERILVVETSSEATNRGGTAEEAKVATIEQNLPSDGKDKAVKNDDAKVPEELWNMFLMAGLFGRGQGPRLRRAIIGCGNIVWIEANDVSDVSRQKSPYGKKGITSGPVFRNLEASVRASVYEYDVILELDTIQKDGKDEQWDGRGVREVRS
jgi:hypothetical protein